MGREFLESPTEVGLRQAKAPASRVDAPRFGKDIGQGLSGEAGLRGSLVVPAQLREDRREFLVREV